MGKLDERSETSIVRPGRGDFKLSWEVKLSSARCNHLAPCRGVLRKRTGQQTTAVPLQLTISIPFD